MGAPLSPLMALAVATTAAVTAAAVAAPHDPTAAASPPAEAQTALFDQSLGQLLADAHRVASFAVECGRVDQIRARRRRATDHGAAPIESGALQHADHVSVASGAWAVRCGAAKAIRRRLASALHLRDAHADVHLAHAHWGVTANATRLSAATAHLSAAAAAPATSWLAAAADAAHVADASHDSPVHGLGRSRWRSGTGGAVGTVEEAAGNDPLSFRARHVLPRLPAVIRDACSSLGIGGACTATEGVGSGGGGWRAAPELGESADFRVPHMAWDDLTARASAAQSPLAQGGGPAVAPSPVGDSLPPTQRRALLAWLDASSSQWDSAESGDSGAAACVGRGALWTADASSLIAESPTGTDGDGARQRSVADPDWSDAHSGARGCSSLALRVRPRDGRYFIGDHTGANASAAAAAEASPDSFFDGDSAEADRSVSAAEGSPSSRSRSAAADVEDPASAAAHRDRGTGPSSLAVERSPCALAGLPYGSRTFATDGNDAMRRGAEDVRVRHCALGTHLEAVVSCEATASDHEHQRDQRPAPPLSPCAPGQSALVVAVNGSIRAHVRSDPLADTGGPSTDHNRDQSPVPEPASLRRQRLRAALLFALLGAESSAAQAVSGRVLALHDHDRDQSDRGGGAGMRPNGSFGRGPAPQHREDVPRMPWSDVAASVVNGSFTRPAAFDGVETLAVVTDVLTSLRGEEAEEEAAAEEQISGGHESVTDLQRGDALYLPPFARSWVGAPPQGQHAGRLLALCWQDPSTAPDAAALAANGVSPQSVGLASALDARSAVPWRALLSVASPTLATGPLPPSLWVAAHTHTHGSQSRATDTDFLAAQGTVDGLFRRSVLDDAKLNARLAAARGDSDPAATAMRRFGSRRWQWSASAFAVTGPARPHWRHLSRGEDDDQEGSCEAWDFDPLRLPQLAHVVFAVPHAASVTRRVPTVEGALAESRTGLRLLAVAVVVGDPDPEGGESPFLRYSACGNGSSADGDHSAAASPRPVLQTHVVRALLLAATSPKRPATLVAGLARGFTVGALEDEGGALPGGAEGDLLAMRARALAAQRIAPAHVTAGRLGADAITLGGSPAEAAAAVAAAVNGLASGAWLGNRTEASVPDSDSASPTFGGVAAWQRAVREGRPVPSAGDSTDTSGGQGRRGRRFGAWQRRSLARASAREVSEGLIMEPLLRPLPHDHRRGRRLEIIFPQHRAHQSAAAAGEVRVGNGDRNTC